MTEEKLLKTIKKAAERKVKRLNLSSKKIAKLPPEIGLLKNLKELNLSDNQLTALPSEIRKLNNLTELDLSANQLTALPPEIGKLNNLTELDLGANQLIALPPEIGLLNNLTTLYLNTNQLTALPPEIGLLNNLRNLALWINPLNCLPPEIGLLNDLTQLFLFANQLTALPPEIGKLNNLTRLELFENRLTALPAEIGQLINLTHLRLSDNLLTSLPPGIGRLENLEGLEVEGNPLTFPPQPIVEQGTKAILAFLREQQTAEERQWVSKMILVGEGGVGKTCTLDALLDKPFQEGKPTTHGIELRPLNLQQPINPEITMKLNCWDFGGQQIYHATHQFFLTDRSLFILVWNARTGWEAGKLHKWLDTIQARAPESPVILVAAHLDERDADLPFAELQREYPQIKGHYEISNKDGTGVKELRDAITTAAADLPLMGEVWPASWLNAANVVRARDEKHIPTQEFYDLMSEHGVVNTDEANNATILAQWLHELGDILYFRDDDDLKDIVILKPQWVSEYVSKVLESDEVIKRDGIFTRTHMNKLWKKLGLTLRERFLHMMERFDLSYRTLERREISLVVERLPLDPPYDYEKKWNAIKDIGNCNEISMKFQLNTIPAGIPTWFIARSHRFTTHTHWRLGALFADTKERKHLGLIRAYPHDRYLQLTVRGPSPHNFFVLLKDGLELTLARFPGLEIKRTTPCQCQNGNGCKHEFDYEDLHKAIERRPPVPQLQCPKSFAMASVPGLLFGLHWLTRDDVISRLEDLRSKVIGGHDQILDRQDLTLTILNELKSLTQRQFADLFRGEQARTESHCPNVFILRPIDTPRWKKILFSGDSLRQQRLPQRMELHLCCQAPGQWHPTIDGGLYEIKESPDWLITIAPLVHRMVTVLKFATPLIPPLTNIINPDVAKKFEDSINLTNELIDRLPLHKDIARREIQDETSDEFGFSHMAGAALRALRQFLDEKDPAQHWGGLRKILTPEGHYLWLCDFHAKEYD